MDKCYRKLKICFVINSLGTGGAETFLVNLLNTLNYSKFDVSLIIVTGKVDSIFLQQKINSQVKFYSLKTNKTFFSLFSSILKMSFIFKQNKFDIISSWLYLSNFLASCAIKITFNFNPKVFWNIRHSVVSLSNESFHNRLLIYLSRFIIDNNTRLIYNSHYSFDRHMAIGFKSNLVHVIHNGFDVNYFESNLNDKIFNHNPLTISIVARHHPMKSFDLFFNIAVKLLSIGKDYQFQLVGSGVTCDLLNMYSVPECLKNRFKFYSHIDDVRSIYSTSDILLVTSSWGESFPNVLAESMLMGVYCIATNIGDTDTIISSFGSVLPVNDIDSFVSEIIAYDDLDPKKKKLLAHGARMHIVNNFSLNYQTQKFHNLFDECSV